MRSTAPQCTVLDPNHMLPIVYVGVTVVINAVCAFPHPSPLYFTVFVEDLRNEKSPEP